jgi:hypothetical protein
MKRVGRYRSLWAAVMLISLSQPLCADIYKYEDPQGNLYFTDRPMGKPGYHLLWKSVSGPSSRPSGTSRINIAGMQKNRQRFSSMIDDVARRTRLRPELLHAVVRAESAYDPQARSRTGAMGLMQLMPGTAKRYGVEDTWDPKDNLDGGARYLRDLLAMFKYDLKLALAAYNAGENAVVKYGNRIPPFPETRNYVDQVLAYYLENRTSAGKRSFN